MLLKGWPVIFLFDPLGETLMQEGSQVEMGVLSPGE